MNLSASAIIGAFILPLVAGGDTIQQSLINTAMHSESCGIARRYVWDQARSYRTQQPTDRIASHAPRRLLTRQNGW